MIARKAEEPAFPTFVQRGDAAEPGMTMREWYAGMALQGILAAHGGIAELDFPPDNKAARWAFEYADAMLARAKEPT